MKRTALLLFSLLWIVVLSAQNHNPLVINSGGVYQGTWHSNNPDVAAVTINTSDTVYIINSTISSRGPVIEVAERGGHIIVRNVHGIGLHPQRDRTLKGRFFDSGNMRDIKYLLLENNLMEGTSGIRVRDCRDATVVIRYNEARHIDGRFAKARDGEYYGNEAFNFRDASASRQFIAMRNCENMRSTVVEWNKVINVANEGYNWSNYANGEATPLPAQEDVFNFNAGGRFRDSIYINNNISIGAYMFDPNTTESYTGGGFIADGGDCKYIVFDGNYAINIQNYSFSVATGGAVVFRNNKGVSCGLLPDGSVSGYNSLALSHQLNNSPGSQFINNGAAYVRTRPRGTITFRNDWKFSNCGNGNCPTTGNERNYPLVPSGQLFGLDVEAQFIRDWEEWAQGQGLTIGLLQGNSQPTPNNAPPSAVLEATVQSGEAPLPVGFSGNNSFDNDGNVVSYEWDFGDGASATGVTGSHTYTTAGTYSVLLTVTDDDGATDNARISITVSEASSTNELPTASLQASATSGIAPLAINFDGSGSRDNDGSIQSIDWDFGDGSTATGARTSHVFTQAGTYTVTMTVTDNEGARVSETVSITATAPPTTGCVLPTGYSRRDIGAVATAGESCYDVASDSYVVRASGSDIWGTGDEFHYVYKLLAGNGEAIVRVTGVENTHEHAKAGIMIRESLNANAAHAFMMMCPTKSALQYRTATGALTEPRGSLDNGNMSAPVWLRLVRDGNLFMGFDSQDGQTWRLIDQVEIPMQQQVFIGLAVTSHDNAQVNTSTFEGLSINEGAAPSLPIELGDFKATLVGSEVELDWVTLQESNNEFFTVERALPGEAFQPIGTVNSQGASLAPQEYQLMDQQPLEGLYYYRLMQTSVDGSSAYLDTVEINVPVAADPTFDLGLSIYPNPIIRGRVLKVKVGNLTHGDVVNGAVDRIVITNNVGQTVFVENNITSKVTRFTVPSSFPLGSYTVTVVHQWGVTSEMIVVTD